MGKCGDCKYWTRQGRTRIGDCLNEHFVYLDDTGTKTPIDGLGYVDSEGYSACFETGSKFGCIHFKKAQRNADGEG